MLAMVFVVSFTAAGMAAENSQGQHLTKASGEQEMTTVHVSDSGNMFDEGISLNQPQKKVTRRSHRINTAAYDDGDMFSEGISYQKREPEKRAPKNILTASEDKDDMFTEGLNIPQQNTTTGPAAEKPVLAASDNDTNAGGSTKQQALATVSKTRHHAKANLVKMPGQRQYKAPEQDRL